MASFPRNRATPAGRSEQTPFTVYRRAFKTNQTSTSIALALATGTQPTTATAGVHELEPGRGVLIKPYGTNADDETFRIAVQIWHPMYDRLEVVRTSEDVVWVPTVIFIGDVILGSDNVVAADAGPIATTDMWAKDIAKAGGSGFQSTTAMTGAASADDISVSAGDQPTRGSTHLAFATWGAKYIQFHIDLTTAASGNMIFAVI